MLAIRGGDSPPDQREVNRIPSISPHFATALQRNASVLQTNVTPLPEEPNHYLMP